MRTLPLWAIVAALAGCAGGEMETQYSADVRVTSPELVAVAPGVQVIADADEPLFYADGTYWLYRDNAWMRSDSYRGGFARVDFNIVPEPLRVIPQPRAYAHYRQHSGRSYARPSQVPQRAPMPAQPAPQPPAVPMQQEPTPPPANPMPNANTNPNVNPNTARPELPKDEREAPVLPSEREKRDQHAPDRDAMPDHDR